MAARRLGELFYELRARTEGLQKDVDGAERQLGRLTTFVLRNPVVAIAAMGTAMAATALQAMRMAQQVETALRRVSTAVPGGVEGLGRLRDAVKSVSLETGKTQEELAQVATQIARTGAGSAEEVATRLRAVVDASQATGADMQQIIGGLDGALDLFNLKAENSAEVLAELFDAAKGRTDFAELLDTLQKAAPGIQRLGLDLPTAARALVALGEGGLSSKQAATALKELAERGAEGRAEVLRLAAAIPRAANPMQQLAEASRAVSNDTANAGARIRAEFNSTLIELGNTLLPLVNRSMRTFLEIIAALRGTPTSLGIADAFAKISENAQAASKAARSSKEWFDANVRVGQSLQTLASAARSGQDVFTQLGREGIGTLIKQLDELRARASSESGLGAQVKMIDQITAAAIKARDALKSVPTVAGSTARPGVSADPAAAAKKRKEEEDAAIAALTKLSGDAEQSYEAALAKAKAALANFEADQREKRVKLAEALIATGRATVDTYVQLFRDIEDQLKAEGVSAQDIPVFLKLKLGIGSLQQDLDKLKATTREVLGKGLKELNDGVAKTDKERSDAAKTAQRDADEALTRAQRVGRQIEDIGNLTLAAADAFGVLSDEAAQALSAVIDVGAGIARIATGDVAGGVTQGLTGVIKLAGQAFGKDPQAAQRQKEHQENLRALREIEKNTGDLVGLSASGRSIATITGGVESLLSASGKAGGFRKFSDQGINEAALLEGATGKSFKEIEALAKSLGVTLNGTKQSYLDFLKALKALDLEAFGKDFAGRIRKLEIEARLDPKAFEGLSGVIKRIQELVGPEGAPAIAAALDGLDLSSVEGRATAIERLTGVLRNISSLDVADLGGLSLDQFIEEILGAIDGLRAAQPAVKSAGDVFRDALEALGVQVEFGTLDAKGKLDAAVEAFKKAFPDLAGLVDTSSAEAFKASVQSVIDGFAADGELTDAERAQIEILRTLTGAFNDATPAAEQLVDSLQVLLDRFELFGVSAAEQVELLLAEFTNPDRIAKNQNFDLLKGLTDGLDLSTGEGVAALRERARQIVLQLAEGGVTEEEQTVIEALKRILGTAEQVASDAAREAADAAERERERRRQILKDAGESIDFEDITDPAEILKRRIAAVAEAFPGLAEQLAGIDTSTEEGRAAFDRLLQDLRERAGEMAELMGIPVEEVLEALGFLEGGLDSLASSVLSVTDQINAALANLDLDLDIAGITDPIERLKRTAATIGDVEQSIATALAGIDLGTAQGRKKAEDALQALAVGANSDLKGLILRLLGQIRGIPDDAASGGIGDTAGAGAGSGRAGDSLTSGLQALSEITGLRMEGWLAQIAANTRTGSLSLDQLVARVAPAGAMVPPALSFPSLAASPTATSAGAAPMVFNFSQNIYGNITVRDAAEFGRISMQAAREELGAVFARDVRLAKRLKGDISALPT